MMNIHADIPMLMLLIANLLLVCACVSAVRRIERAARDLRAFDRAELQQAASHDARVLPSMLERRLAVICSRLDELAVKQDLQASPPPDTPLANATRMAKKGASVDDLIRGCGLTAAEAELLRRLHANPQTREVKH